METEKIDCHKLEHVFWFSSAGWKLTDFNELVWLFFVVSIESDENVKYSTDHCGSFSLLGRKTMNFQVFDTQLPVAHIHCIQTEELWIFNN